jgi:hypothetical protein
MALVPDSLGDECRMDYLSRHALDEQYVVATQLDTPLGTWFNAASQASSSPGHAPPTSIVISIRMTRCMVNFPGQ